MVEENYTVQENGFQGIFIKESQESDKAMIVIGGSEGGIKAAYGVAKVFAEEGIHSLAVAYWGTELTAESLELIPIEIIQTALDCLKKKGYGKVGIYGVSKGAELALTVASLIPELDFVIAVSPAAYVFEGIRKKAYSKTASWTWQGKPLIYLNFEGIKANMVKKFFKNKEMGFRNEYLKALELNKSEENVMKVENIKGPVLLLSAKGDSQWPAEIMGDMVMRRLQEKSILKYCRKERT